MRSDIQITRDMMDAAASSEPDKYPLRLLKAQLLTVELLIDVRRLLQGLQPPTMILRQAEVKIDDKGLHRED